MIEHLVNKKDDHRQDYKLFQSLVETVFSRN